MKEKIFGKFTWFYILVAFVVVICAFVGCSSIVNAEETVEENFTYTWKQHYGSWGESLWSISIPYPVVLVKTGEGVGYTNGSYTYDDWISYEMFLYDETGLYLDTYYETVSSQGKTMCIYDIFSGKSSYSFKTSDIKAINMPIFGSIESAQDFFISGDDSGQLNKSFNMATDGIFNPDLPIPQLVFDKEEEWTTFQIANAVDGYNIEIRGRWYSVDDIELYKEGVFWCHKYSTILRGVLTDWVTYIDKIPSTGIHQLTDYGAVAWSDFLETYPVNERNYFGGTNAVGNYFSGYSDALNMLKMRLECAGMSYTPAEIYVRFYYETDDGVYFSKWTHYMRDFAGQGTSGSALDDADNLFTDNQSQVGLTDEELDFLEKSGESFNDTDLQPNYNNPNSLESVVGDEVWTVIKNMANSLGTFPELVGKVFSFLPSWIINLISVGIGFVVVLRFLGR